MEMEPKVSVIIPTHKGSGVVERAVDSVLRQTYRNIEVIVVDDNGRLSEEQVKTEEVLKTYINDGLIKYVPHEVNINGSAARNTGVKNSIGEYITLLDDDDEYLPDKVEMQVKCFENLSNEYGMVYCGIQVNYPNNSYKRIPLTSGDLFLDLLFHYVVIGSDTLMVRRTCFEEIDGFDESFRRHQDFEFTARIAKKWKIKAIEKVGVVSYELNRNNPTQHDIQVEHRRHYLEKMLPIMKELPKRTQRDVISVNLVMLHGNDLRKFKFFKVYREIIKESQNILDDYNFYDFLRSIILVECHKLFGKKNRVKVDKR